MEADGGAVIVIATLAPLVVGVLGWLGKRQIERVERDVEAERNERSKRDEEERVERIRAQEADRIMFMGLFERSQTAWMASLDKERDAAKADRHEFRNELATWGAHLNTYKLEAAEKFVNGARLAETLRPLTEAVDRFRDDIKELFTKVDGKVDKTNHGRRGGHGGD